MTTPTTTFNPPTKRLRIEEMKFAYRDRTGRKIGYADIAAVAFHGARLAKKTRLQYIALWNNGSQLWKVTEKNLSGMAEALGCTVQDLTGE